MPQITAVRDGQSMSNHQPWAGDDAGGAPVSAPAPSLPTRRPIGASIAHGAFALLSTQPITWAASLVGTIALPRLLGADALGQFTIATTIISLSSTAACLGVSDYLVKRV